MLQQILLCYLEEIFGEEIFFLVELFMIMYLLVRTRMIYDA